MAKIVLNPNANDSITIKSFFKYSIFFIFPASRFLLEQGENERLNAKSENNKFDFLTEKFDCIAFYLYLSSFYFYVTS